jgi:hypothetical protein
MFCVRICPFGHAPNETVEKLVLGSTFPNQPLAEGPDSRSEGGLTDVLLRQGSVECPERVDPAEIVDHSGPRTRPLYIHFQFGPVHALLDTDVGEDRLDNTCNACGARI